MSPAASLPAHLLTPPGVHAPAPRRDPVAARAPDAPSSTPADATDEPRSFWTLGPYVLVANLELPADRIVLGSELSIVRHSHTTWESLACSDGCWGAFGQVESTPSLGARDERVVRAAVGGQASLGPLGLELGPALETTPSGGALVGLHAATFLSFGIDSVAVRLTTYPGRFGEPDHGLEAALVIRATFPLLLPLVYIPRSGEVSSVGFTKALGRFPM